MYASRVRRLFLIALLPFAAGCRPPEIPARPSAREYAVYSGWIEQASNHTPHDLSFAVDDQTLTLDQSQMQFQQCLPPRMETIFDEAPTAHLTASSGNDWLQLADGRSARLLPHTGEPPVFAQSTELIRLSRVAFTRSGFEAYLWVEHRTCAVDGENTTCTGNSGTLLRGARSDSVWSFEDTNCHTIVFPSS